MSTAAGKELVEDFLEHYGVKGMKWGVRRHNRDSAARRASNLNAKADRQEAYGAKKTIGSGRMAREAKINRAKANKSSARAAKIDNGMAKRAAKGESYIQRVQAANAAAAAKRVAPQDIKVKTSTTSAGKAKIAVSGGKRFPVDPDAVKAATVKRQYKKSGVDSLSNEQLQTLQNRLNLETNVDRLVKNDTRSQTFLQKLFKEQGQQQLDAINKDPIGSAKKAQAVADTIQTVAKKHKKT